MCVFFFFNVVVSIITVLANNVVFGFVVGVGVGVGIVCFVVVRGEYQYPLILFKFFCLFCKSCPSKFIGTCFFLFL